MIAMTKGSVINHATPNKPTPNSIKILLITQTAS